MVIVFFFKQKTAYEMRISDWSSDVGSSDLSNHAVAAICYQPDRRALVGIAMAAAEEQGLRLANAEAQLLVDLVSGDQALMRREIEKKIGRASCRERVCQYV